MGRIPHPRSPEEDQGIVKLNELLQRSYAAHLRSEKGQLSS